MSLLESAGFSQANPYYIVPQGRVSLVHHCACARSRCQEYLYIFFFWQVTSLTTVKDEDRLKLLKEIAGTRVYEQKRAESNKLMQDTRK